MSGTLLVGAESRNPVLAVLWIISGSAMYALLVFVHTFFTNPRPAAMFSNLLIMILGMLGGSFFPFDLMPDSLTRIGRWTPNGLALQLFRNILAGQLNRTRLAVVFASALCFLSLLFAASARRLRRKFLI